MFPTELEINQHRLEMQRQAENQRLIRSLRSEPTFWQRIRALIGTRRIYATAPRAETPLARPDVIATSR